MSEDTIDKGAIADALDTLETTRDRVEAVRAMSQLRELLEIRPAAPKKHGLDFFEGKPLPRLHAPRRISGSGYDSYLSSRDGLFHPGWSTAIGAGGPPEPHPLPGLNPSTVIREAQRPEVIEAVRRENAARRGPGAG